MKASVASLAFLAMASVGSVAVWTQGTSSQWDGIYTADQAMRGEKLYQEKCSTCHGSDVLGTEMAPSLSGGDFSKNWDDLTIGDLFELIHTSMPQNDPGSLSTQQVADILAFLLSKGEYQPGQTELPAKADQLKAIKFLAKNPKAAK